jgi:hypothetical protein
MILLACFATLGFAAGFVLRLPAFAALLLLAVVGYAVFNASLEGALLLAYHAVLVGIAGQVGYFVAVVAQAVFRNRSKASHVLTKSASRKNVSRDPHQER